MSPRAGIIAGKSIIVVQVQDSVDAALKRIGSNLNKFSAKVNRLGFEMFSGGFLGSLGLTALAKQFEDFEDKLLFLSTKLVATEAELAGVEKTIRQLGRTTSFTASQVADAATVLAQAGFNAAQVTKLLQPTLDLARGAQIDLASSGAILANTLRSFSLEADKATEVASQFIAAARLGTLDVLDLKESIKEVLGTVRNLNIDLPTTLALITQLAERSLKGTKAGTSLNTALLQLASKGKQLAKLGLVLPENIDGPGFIKFLEQLYDKISKLGNLKRTAVLQSIFNIRGGRAITALDDIKKIIDLQKQIAAAGDEARKAAVKMDSGFGGAIRRASSAIEGLTLRWGKLLADAIIPTLDLVPALSLALEQLTKANQTLVTGLILSPVAILGLGAGLLVASFAAAKLAGVIGLLAGGIRGTGRLIGGLLTQQLTNVAVLMDRIRKSARSFDRGLSAALLTPQLVGGRGRNARKIKPTSFLGRVGATQAGATAKSGLGAATAATNYLVAATKSLYTNLKALGPKAVSVYSRMAAAISKALAPNKRLLAQQRAFRRTQIALIQLNTDSVTPKLPESKALVSIGNKQNAALARKVSLTKQIAAVDKKLATITNYVDRSALVIERDVLTAEVASNKKALNALAARRNKLEVARIARGQNLVNKAVLAGGVKQAALQAKLARIGRFKSATQFGATFAKTSTTAVIAKTGTALARLWSGGLKLVVFGFRTLWKIDFVRIFLSGAKAVWSLTKAFGALAAISFKTLTTLSGWGNILTFLLIFGPKIKFIREAFERLGAGIRSAFGAIGSIATAVGPAFSLIGKSMKTLLAGDGDLGFQQLSTALSAIVDIVGNKLSEAWNHLTLAIAPAYDFIVKLISSTAELGKLFANTFGASLGNTLSNLANLFQGGGLGGGIGEMIRGVFEAIDMKGIFEGIGLAIVGMASSVNDTMKLIYNAIAQTMRDLRIAMIAFLGVLPSNKSNDFAPTQAMEKLAGQKFLRFNPSTGQFEEIAENFYQFDLKVTRANQSFDGFTNKLDKFLKTFKDGLTNIFTAPALEPAKIKALNLSYTESQVQQMLLGFANETADRLSKSPKGPFSNLGQFIGAFNGIPVPTKNPLAALFGGTGTNNNIDAVFGKIFNKDNLSAIGKNAKAVFTTAAAKADPAAVAKAQIPFIQSQLKDLRLDTARLRKDTVFKGQALGIQPPGQFAALGVQKTVESPQEFLKRQRTLKQIIDNAQRAGLLKDQVRELRKQARGTIAAPQRAQLSDLVSSVTGSFQQTRRNLLKFASGQSVEQKSLTALEQIQDNTSQTTGNLDQILQHGLPVTMGLK